MKNLQVDRSTSGGIQVFQPGESSFATVTDTVKADIFEEGDTQPEVIVINAVTEIAYVYGDDPSVPADMDSGHYLPEGSVMPVVIPPNKKLAVKGTARISW